MALVIENGSGVPGAESFATADELVTYALNFGKVIPAEPIQLEALLRRAALQMNALPWKGGAARRDQPLSWPRAGVKRNGWVLPHNQTPPQIKAGQMALAAEIRPGPGQGSNAMVGCCRTTRLRPRSRPGRWRWRPRFMPTTLRLLN